MRHYTDDRTREKLTPEETTILRITGPLRSMIGRGELHLSKDSAGELAGWLGFTVPDPMWGFNAAEAALPPKPKSKRARKA